MDRRYRKRMDRHWAAAEARGRSAIDRLDPTSWFDQWHTHVDWNGRGNSRPENAVAVNACAVRLLQYLESRLSARTEPVQAWASLCPSTMDTAIYAHSANPNGSDFPHDFSYVNWSAPVPTAVAAIVPPGYQLGLARYGESSWYVVQRGPNNSSKPTPLRGAA